MTQATGENLSTLSLRLRILTPGPARRVPEHPALALKYGTGLRAKLLLSRLLPIQPSGCAAKSLSAMASLMAADRPIFSHDDALATSFTSISCRKGNSP